LLRALSAGSRRHFPGADGNGRPKIIAVADAARVVRFPAAQVARRELPVLVFDLGASIVVCHRGKEQAAATLKGSFG